MRQFNLEEYLKNPNQKVVTRSGKNVRIVCTDRVSDSRPVIALIDIGICEEYTSVKADGSFGGGTPSEYDLFFAPEKDEGWVILRKSRYGLMELANIENSTIYNFKEEAEKRREQYVNKDDLRICKIEWEG